MAGFLAGLGLSGAHPGRRLARFADRRRIRGDSGRVAPGARLADDRVSWRRRHWDLPDSCQATAGPRRRTPITLFPRPVSVNVTRAQA